MDKELLTMLKTGTLLLMVAAAAHAQEAKELYAGKCAACHGADGAGQTMMGKRLKVVGVRDLVGKQSAADMEAMVRKGKAPAMKAYTELSNDQVKAVVEYYRGLAK